MSRLTVIYRQTRDRDVREFLLSRMPFMVECDEAVAFLATAAEEAPPALYAPPAAGAAIITDDLRRSLQASAVDLLVDFGSRGEAALRRLHVHGTVRDSSARAQLERYAKQGFRRPPR
ncbi:MAG: hypothetical protein HYV19_03855 [Gemmatimonadetes bacterium]|nr:hypothetical protein [Gemmatimonadota bacterium]